jgi:hypothetical protein
MEKDTSESMVHQLLIFMNNTLENAGEPLEKYRFMTSPGKQYAFVSLTHSSCSYEYIK